ncbi:MAG: response regulator transcription factor [Gemmatimonadota bacterium]
MLLDLMLPHLDGIEVCRRLRQDERTARLPIIMLTAKDDTADRIKGFEVGADDYINKPFNLQELMLRVAAVLRRRENGDDSSSRTVGIDILRLDPGSRIVTVDDVEVDLTAREFDLLYFLINHANRVFSRADLLRHVWDYDYTGYDRTVDAHVARLRRKLGRAGAWIETEWGIGYKFRAPSG